ncbi:hypothetical protein LXL04_004377 [Taraxacum kok-saghyz]
MKERETNRRPIAIAMTIPESILSVSILLDMQARLLLDMLGKGIESSLINPSALVDKPWQASGETLNNIDHEAMAYVDAVLDLASHFITKLQAML